MTRLSLGYLHPVLLLHSVFVICHGAPPVSSEGGILSREIMKDSSGWSCQQTYQIWLASISAYFYCYSACVLYSNIWSKTSPRVLTSVYLEARKVKAHTAHQDVAHNSINYGKCSFSVPRFIPLEFINRSSYLYWTENSSDYEATNSNRVVNKLYILRAI